VAAVDGSAETDISIAGFCSLHRNDAAEALAEAVMSDEAVLSLVGPAVELRADQVQPFLQFVRQELAQP
jgi:hypothetical protein